MFNITIFDKNKFEKFDKFLLDKKLFNKIISLYNMIEKCV